MTSISSGLRLQSIQYNTNLEMESDARMPSWPDEIQTRMHPQIRLFRPLRLLLLPHIRLMLAIDKLDNRRQRITIVDIVAKPRSVDHRQLALDLFLFQLGLDDFDLGNGP